MQVVKISFIEYKSILNFRHYPVAEVLAYAKLPGISTHDIDGLVQDCSN